MSEDSRATSARALLGTSWIAIRFFGIHPVSLAITGGIIATSVVYAFAWRYICDREPVSPLVLDLDGDGVEASGVAYFDFDGDGFKELSNWVSEDDGILVLDLNENGVIDDGSELFGDRTLIGEDYAEHGFNALEQLDSNGDRVINDQDADWSKLRILRWTDHNSNGMMDDDESRLESLSTNNVATLNLAYSNSDKVDDAGNEHRQVGSYISTTGTSLTMTDVWFQTNPIISSYDRSEIPEYTAAINALPEVLGKGHVYSLRDAMALDEAGELEAPFYGSVRTETRTLSELVTAFVAATDTTVRDELLEKILHRWAGAEDVSVSDFWSGHNSFAHTSPTRLAVVEAFQGRQWRAGESYRHPTKETALDIDRVYLNHLEHLRAQIVMQTSLSDVFEAIVYRDASGTITTASDLFEADEGELSIDFSGVVSLLPEVTQRSEFLRTLAVLSPNNSLILAGLKNIDSLWAYEYRFESDYLVGMVPDNIEASSSVFTGSSGQDVFRSIDGSTDSLRGGDGADLYQLVRGTGHDTIDESYGHDGNDGDVIELEVGIEVSDVQLRRDQNHLWVELLSAPSADGTRTVSDSLKVHDYFRYDAAKVEELRFADGTVWGTTEFHATPLRGGVGSDIIHGRWDLADIFDADAGGNDKLYGLGGNDVYRLGRGTGFDEIYEGYDGNYRRTDNGDTGDVIELEAGIEVGDVQLRRDHIHLWVELLGEPSADGTRPVSDSLKVHDYFKYEVAKIEELRFADGTVWGTTEFHATPLRGGVGSDIIYGRWDLADIFDADAGGNDKLYGMGGNDVYRLGRGTGFDEIYEGYDGNYRRTDNGDTGDVIELEAGIEVGDVQLRRDQHHLWVELLGEPSADGTRPVSDSLKVHDYFKYEVAKIEELRFADGTVWGTTEFHATPLRGGVGSDIIHGRSDLADIFDADAGGNDKLYGLGGNDVYRLGRGTGLDEIYEGKDGNYRRTGDGDTGDVIELEAGIEVGDVQLRRDQHHLWVELLGEPSADGTRPVSDSLKVHDYFKYEVAKIEELRFADGTVWGTTEFHATPLRGGVGSDIIHGRSDLADIFDADAGGNDKLYGLGGNDVYRLGRGTGLDEIYEGYDGNYRRTGDGDAGDVIELEAGIEVGDVQLRRDHTHLWVELLGEPGADGTRSVSDSLKVHDYFKYEVAKIEELRFADGTVWGTTEFHATPLRGGVGSDIIHGRWDLADIFDADAGGNDKLYGLGGNDVYRLGRGTGFDEIYEGYDGNYRRTDNGDAGDVIELEAGIEVGDVQLRRDHTHLWVELLGEPGADGTRSVSDSLKVHDYFKYEVAKIEELRFADGTVWGTTEFHATPLRGGVGSDIIHGRSDLADIFDADAGGNDKLYGLGGNDVYRLGRGTGLDEIYEGKDGNYRRTGDGDAGDVIELEAGIEVGDVQLRRDHTHLWVELLGEPGADGTRSVSDSLKVHDYFKYEVAKIEELRFADGTVWGTTEFHATPLRGGVGSDIIHGRWDLADIFDADAGGNDKLYGLGGNDVYRLGRGTGLDEIYEGKDGNYRRTGDGDAGDVIELEAGIEVGDVQLRRDHTHLWVELLGEPGADGTRSVSDSLKVHDYFKYEVAKIEELRFADGTVWGTTEFHATPLRGGVGSDIIHGRWDLADIFDADVGGNDKLYGLGGNDVYRLGRGTGLDEIYEGKDGNYRRTGDGDAGDVIELEAGIEVGDVQLRRDQHHLWVELLGEPSADGTRTVSDSLKVHDYYRYDVAKVEVLRFVDGTRWQGTFVVGSDTADTLVGSEASEVLYGGLGDDSYELSSSFGEDRIVDQGGTDIVKLTGYETSKLSFLREGDDMVMEVLDTDDRMVFEGWYGEDDAGRMERIEVGSSVLLASVAEQMAGAMATFIADGGSATDFVSQSHQDYWATFTGTPSGL